MSPTHLQYAYALLVDAMRTPRKKAALEEAVGMAVRAVRAVIQETGADPDAAFIERGPLVGSRLPDLLHVTAERDTDGEYFFIAHDDGVVGLDNGQRVGTYRLESTGVVKVTTELLSEAPHA